MDINELESFKISDAVKFHKELNPRLWDNEKLDPEVRDQLLLIAKDFVEYLGLDNLKVEDVTISGSNAAYSYTPHSDLDLHILVDFNKLPNDPVYQELFTAKKTLYNDLHDITVREVPVELYVQDTNQPVQSLGEYSIVHDKWIRIPKKRRANFDQAATKLKYEKLGELIELALKSRDPKRVDDTTKLIKRYRKSGLDKTGEFGPENLAYKAVRKQGLVQALYDLKAELHGEKLSIDEDVGSIADTIKAKLGLKQFIVTERGDDLILDSLIVGKENQGKGLGTTAMKQLIDYADQNGKRIILTPGVQDKTHGTTSRSRLVKFYKSLGFKENKGRNIDFAMGAGKMYRDPAKNITEYIEDLKSYRNPSPKTLYNLTKRSAYKHMRGMYHEGNTYWWDANDAIHKDGADALGIPYDYLNRLEAAIDKISDNYYVGGDDGVPTKIIQRYDVEELAESTNTLMYHVTPTRNLRSIMKQGLTPRIGDRSAKMAGEESGIFLFPTLDDVESAVSSWLGDEFDEDEELSLLAIDVSGLSLADSEAGYEKIAKTRITPDRISLSNELILESSVSKAKNALKSSASYTAIYMCEGTHYSKDMLLEQRLYENFLNSATQFLGQKANQTMANIKGQINDTVNAGIVIKDIISNPQLLTNTTSQIRKWTSQLVKNVTTKIQQIGQQLNAPQLTEKLIAAWEFISRKVAEFGSSDGWKGFLGSLGIYGFVKFINEMLQNLTTLKSTIANGALDALLDKAKELGSSVLGNITMPGFLAIFDKLTTVKKYFLDVLTQVKDKFGAISIPGTAQFSKGVQLEASGYIPSAKEKNDPRFKTALTVDVKPNSIKKNAKAFNWKTTRAGIPPQARADGKITEALVSYTPSKKFVNEKEEITYVANSVKDWRIRQRIFETIATRNINESEDNYQAIRTRVIKSLGSFSSKNLKIGDRYIPVQINLWRDSLLFYDVTGNTPAQQPAKFGTLVDLSNDEAKIQFDDQIYNYPIHIDSANVMMVTVFLDSAEKYDQFRMMVRLQYDQSLPPLLSVDDLTESLLSEWKSFLKEDEQPELFPGYDKEHREKRLDNWLQNTHAWDGHKPRIFYHATTKDFDTFNTHGTGFASALGMAFEVERHGSFFAVDPKFAEEFIQDSNRPGQYKEGGRVIPVYLSVQNPIDLRDNSLSRMTSNSDTVEGFAANNIDLKSIYFHIYEDQRWELFDGPEGAEFVENLQKLGFDGAIIHESPEQGNVSGEVWVVFNPNQVKSVHNRGSFSPDDPRLMREDQKNVVPKVAYHVTATKNLPIIQKNGIKADRRGNSYVWDSLEMAEWFMGFQNDEGQDRTILKIDMTGIDARPDPESEDMSEWSSRFESGTHGGAWIVSGSIPPNKIIG